MSQLPEEEDDTPTAPFWMATFSDMVTLLLTFFVMLVAMSSVEVKKFKEALSYFPGRTGIMQETAGSQVMPHQGHQGASRRTLSPQEKKAYDEFMRQLGASGLARYVTARLDDVGLHIVITDSVMFASGQADLLPTSQMILGLLSDLVTLDAKGIAGLRVEGHTDDRPIATARYPSNWELSAARAASVVRFMLMRTGALPPERYSAVGFSSHQPVASNRTAEGRARNRRVEIHFLWDLPPLPPTASPDAAPWPGKLTALPPTPSSP